MCAICTFCNPRRTSMNIWSIFGFFFALLAVCSAFALGVEPLPGVNRSVQAAVLTAASLGFITCVISIAARGIIEEIRTREKE